MPTQPPVPAAHICRCQDGHIHCYLGDWSWWCHVPRSGQDAAFVAAAVNGGDLHIGLPDLTAAEARELAAALLQIADDVDRANVERAG